MSRNSLRLKADPTPPTTGLTAETRAFLASGAGIKGPESRRRTLLAALEIGAALNALIGPGGNGGPDVIFTLLWESANEAGIGEAELVRLVDETFVHLDGSSSFRPSVLPPGLAPLTAARKADRLDARLKALWESAAT